MDLVISHKYSDYTSHPQYPRDSKIIKRDIVHQQINFGLFGEKIQCQIIKSVLYTHMVF